VDDDVARARIGRELGGHYRVERLIGRGGMGAVYEARNTWTDRRVAVKLLHPELVKKREMVARFLTEARAASAIRHPNIVDVLDMGVDDVERTLYIVQEFLEGEDLATRLERDGTLRPREALDVIVPVMGALVSAHRLGVIHRDVKPENVFLARGEGGAVAPKLIDFGIARILAADTDQRTTRTGTTIGTPQYMSPEQARGEDDLDARTDVWALGVLLYECLSGVRPFEAANYNLVVVKIITERPAPLREVAPAVPASVAAVVERALALDRDDRFADMAEMLAALLRCRVADGTAELATRHARSLRSPEEDARAAESARPLPLPELAALPADRTAPSSPTSPARGGRWFAGLAVVAALSAGVLLGRGSAPAVPAQQPPTLVLRAPVIAPPPMAPSPPVAAPPVVAAPIVDAGHAVAPRAPSRPRAVSAPPREPARIEVPRSGNRAPILPP